MTNEQIDFLLNNTTKANELPHWAIRALWAAKEAGEVDFMGYNGTFSGSATASLLGTVTYRITETYAASLRASQYCFKDIEVDPETLICDAPKELHPTEVHSMVLSWSAHVMPRYKEFVGFIYEWYGGKYIVSNGIVAVISGKQPGNEHLTVPGASPHRLVAVRFRLKK